MDASKKKNLIFRIAIFLVLILIAAAMFVVGRGHTIYFDNKVPENASGDYEIPYKIEVLVNGEKVAKLKEGERGMADTMGQNFEMDLLVTKEKDGKSSRIHVGLPLPYNMDGIIINLPALLQGQDESVYLAEFIPTPSSEELEDEEVVTDETEGLMDFGE